MSVDGKLIVEDTLVHFGKKGMKWGQRKSNRPSGSDVKNARKRIDKKYIDDYGKIEDSMDPKKPKSVAKGYKALGKLDAEYKKDPDRATALRMTKGEVFADALLGTLMAAGTRNPAIGLGVGLTRPVSRVVSRKIIERKQASGAYDKK